MEIASSLLCPPMPYILSYKSQLTYEISCSAQVSKSAKSRLPDGDQLTIQHLFSLKRPAHQKTSLLTRYKNLSSIFASFFVCTKYTCEPLYAEKGINDAESVATTELQQITSVFVQTRNSMPSNHTLS